MMEKSSIYKWSVGSLSNYPIANKEIEEVYWGMWRSNLS